MTDTPKTPVQTGEIVTADGYAYKLPDGTLIPLSFDDKCRWAQVQVLNSVHNYLAGKPFVEHYSYQPPWGDAIPIFGDTRAEQDRDIERLNEYYRKYPTAESFKKLHAEPLGETGIEITTSIKWEPWVTYRANAPILPISEPPCKDCAHWRPIVIFDKYGNFDGVRMCQSDKMLDDFSCYVQRKDNK